MITSERQVVTISHPRGNGLEDTSSDITVHIDEWGDSSSPVLIWLHSEWGPFNRLPFSDKLAKSCHGYALHLPGWGTSTGVDVIRSLPEMALAMWEVVEDVITTDQRPIVVGQGIGATVSLEMGIQQPHRVSRVVAINPFGMWAETVGGADMFGLTPSDILPHLFVNPSGDAAAECFPDPADDHEKAMAMVRRAERLGSAARYLFPIPDTGIGGRLYRLRESDVDIVWGESNGVLPVRAVDMWREYLVSATYHVVPDGSHLLLEERPHDVEKILSTS